MTHSTRHATYSSWGENRWLAFDTAFDRVKIGRIGLVEENLGWDVVD